MTVSTTIARDIVQFAASYGVTSSTLCDLSGISPTDLNNPDRRITLEQLDQLWQQVVRLTNDPWLGLHLGEQFNLNAIGVVGYLMQNSPHLGAALQQAMRYGKIIGDVLDIQAFPQGDLVEITFTPVPAWQVLNTLSLRQSVEYDMAFALRCFQELSGQPLWPAYVSFAHPATDLSVYQEAFRTELRFGQATNAMAFDGRYLQLPVVTVHHGLLATLEPFAQQLLRQLARQTSVGSQVKQIVIQQIGNDTLDLASVADQLHMSKRTLQRKLQEEGSSFQKIIDEVRMTLAEQYLRQGGLSISETAYLLGFSEAVAFHRFFKQQTGNTPQSYQESFG